MEPMDLDSDADSSFGRGQCENDSDMEFFSFSPTQEQEAVKASPSFEYLECALSSVLSLNKSPGANAESMPLVLRRAHSEANTDIQNLNTSQFLNHGKKELEKTCRNRMPETVQQSSHSKKELKKGYGIPDDEDLISQCPAQVSKVNENSGVFLRKITSLKHSKNCSFDYPKLETNASAKSNSAKSMARSLVSKTAKDSFQKTHVSWCAKIMKFTVLFCFFICLVVVTLTKLINFQKQSCNRGKHFSKRVLELDLEGSVFGQHIAVNAVPMHVDLYLRKFQNEEDNETECKPLVLSFHGWTGVGKNYISKIIANTLHYSKVNNFIIPYHFPHEAFQSLYRDEIKAWIVNNITDCAINILVLDEMDKAFPDIVEGIAGAIDALTKPCHLAVPTVFLLLSNSHAIDINRAFLHFMSASPQNTREQFALKDVNFASDDDSWLSWLSNKNLIDAFVPFLPLEKRHVIQCIKRDLVSKRFSTDSKSINRILKELSFSVFGELELSNTGCKRVTDKVDLVMLDGN